MLTPEDVEKMGEEEVFVLVRSSETSDPQPQEQGEYTFYSYL